MKAIDRALLSVRAFVLGERLTPGREVWMLLAFCGLLAVIMGAALHFMWKSLQP
jgi:hypothetical protein